MVDFWDTVHMQYYVMYTTGERNQDVLSTLFAQYSSTITSTDTEVLSIRK